MAMKENVFVFAGLIGTVILVWIFALTLGFLPGSNRYLSTFDAMKSSFSTASKTGSTVADGFDFFYKQSYEKDVCLYDGSHGSAIIHTKKPEPGSMGWTVLKNAQDHNLPVIIFTKSDGDEGLIEHLKNMEEYLAWFGEFEGTADLKILRNNINKLSGCRSGYCMCYVELYWPYASYGPEGFEIIELELHDNEGFKVAPSINENPFSSTLVDLYWDLFTELHKTKLFSQANFLKMKPIVRECIDFATICSCSNPSCGYQTTESECNSLVTYGMGECSWVEDDDGRGVCYHNRTACLPTVSNFVFTDEFHVSYKITYSYYNFGLGPTLLPGIEEVREREPVFSFDGAYPFATFSPASFYQQTTDVSYFTKTKKMDVGEMKDQQVFIDRVGCVINVRDMSRQNDYYFSYLNGWLIYNMVEESIDMTNYATDLASKIYSKGIYPACNRELPPVSRFDLNSYDRYFYGDYKTLGGELFYVCKSEGCEEWAKRTR